MANIEGFDTGLVSDIKVILKSAKSNIIRSVNSEMLLAYWHIGKLIVNHEHGGVVSAEYGTQFLKNLSKTLSKDIGRGFSISNLQFMRRLYLVYENQQTLSVNLSWSHYCELLAISDDSARGFYEKEASNSRWSVR